MNIEVYMNDDIREGAMKALKYRLFQTGWELGVIYRNIKFEVDINVPVILIAIVEGIPVASAIHINDLYYDGCDFQIFVRKSYRRKGIGSELYNEMMKILNRTDPLRMCHDHTRAAECFYNKNRNKLLYISEDKQDDFIEIEVSFEKSEKQLV